MSHWNYQYSTEPTGVAASRPRVDISQSGGNEWRQRYHAIKATYDSAATNSGNARHWVHADSKGAKTANNESVRHTIRNRARYEIANNTYAKGIVLTIANRTIGTGPRLQIQTGNKEANVFIEREISRWMKSIGLDAKLRSLVNSRCGDGEAVGVKITNRSLRTPVKLDLRLVESDMLHNPLANIIDPYQVDGIFFDTEWNVNKYRILNFHPGDNQPWFGLQNWFTDYDRYQVIHLFRVDRPGQVRGMSEISPALPLFAMLRRYTLAVIKAAEAVASVTLALKNPGSGVAPAILDAGETWDYEHGTGFNLPDGWDIFQVHAEQPMQNYGEFKRQIINEIARCLNMPINIAMCDSSSYNFASGKLDQGVFDAAIAIDRADIERVVLDSLLDDWLEEAFYIEGYLPEGLPPIEEWSQSWFWDAPWSVDPVKDENAREIRLNNLTTTYSEECSSQGRDAEQVLEKNAEFFGVTVEQLRKDMYLKRMATTATVASDALEQGVKPQQSNTPVKQEGRPNAKIVTK